MRVLADFHHQALYHSLHLLFEDRLGWELFRPIGEEWWTEGYWKVYNHPHTAAQFLGLHQGTDMPMDVHGAPLPEVERKNLHYKVEDGIYYIKDLTYDTTHRAVRLEKFKNMKFDIILASMPNHIDPYLDLIEKFQPQAKLIFQIGNRWTPSSKVKNIMASTASFKSSKNIVFYHQEFDLNVFDYQPPKFHNIVHSYVHYMKKKTLMHQTCALPGWQAINYGAGMEQQLQGAEAVAEAMKRSAFTWQYKPGGDGFGHVIYSSYACGRPALIWREHYKGCGARKLFEDKVTCIDTSTRLTHELQSMLKHYSQPEEHLKMCEAAYKRFQDTVSFDEDFENIKVFLENLQ